MRTFVIVVTCLLFSLACSPASRAQTPACAGPAPTGGEPAAFNTPLNERDRIALSAAVHATLFNGSDPWPGPQIAGAPRCVLGEFEAEGLRYTLFAGRGRTPPRWATSPDNKRYVFLAVGPSPAEAYESYTATPPRSLGLPKRPHYYLIHAFDDLYWVMQVYDGPPDAERLQSDMAQALGFHMRQMAVYDPTGAATTVILPTQDAIRATVFLDPERAESVRMYGPDGTFFLPVTGGAVRLMGSGFVCPQAIGEFNRLALTILDARQTHLDLLCPLKGARGFVTTFITRYGDDRPASAVFQAHLDEAEASGEAAPLVPTGGASQPQFGRTWRDAKGLGQGLWITRRGRYYVEVRSTYQAEGAEAMAQAVSDIHGHVFADIPVDAE